MYAYINIKPEELDFYHAMKTSGLTREDLYGIGGGCIKVVGNMGMYACHRRSRI